MNKIKRIINRLLLIFVSVVSINTFASDQSCIQKYNSYVEAKVLWQKESTALTIRALPQYADLANYYRDVQLSSINLSNFTVQLMLQQFPNEIDTSVQLNQWVELSPELEVKLSEKSADFIAALQNHKRLTAIIPNGDGDEFRKAFRDVALPSDEFQSLLSDFNQKIASIDAVTCTKH